MSNPDNPNQLPPQLAIIITLIVLTLIIVPTVILVQWWFYYSATVLLWDRAQTTVISFAGMAVLMAILIVVAMQKLSKSTNKEDTDRFSGLVIEWTGWALVLISLSLSESQNVLHVSKHIYFPLAIFGLAMLGYSNGRRYKSTGDKMSLIAIFIVAMALGAELFRYIAGLPRLTV